MIGVLALQGDVIEHITTLRKLQCKGIEVRTSEHLQQCDGLILPGGESTTLIKLLQRVHLDTEIQRRATAGMPLFGTCAGMILLAKEIVESTQPGLKLMDIVVERNAYGRQVDSFTAALKPIFSKREVKAAFIRAPRIVSVGKDVQVLASFKDHPVLVREHTLLAASFHPELYGETAVHEYFLEMVSHSSRSLL